MNKTTLLGWGLLALAVCGQAQAQDKHIDITVQNRKLMFLNSECPGNPQQVRGNFETLMILCNSGQTA